MNSVNTRLLIIWLAGVLAATLAPFGFVAADASSLRMFQYGAFERDPVHFALNALLFLPLGLLLHQHRRRGAASVRSTVLVAGITGLSISLTVESLQAFLPTRDSSLFDLLANTSGAILGVAISRRWGARADACFARVRTAVTPAVLAGSLGGLLGVALLISGALQHGTRLSNWNAEYPLLIGNELTGDRPWRGRLFALEITDAALPAASVRRFSAGESVVLPGSPIASFAFNGSAPYADASGHLRSLERTQPSDATSQPGVWLGHRSWLRSQGSVPTLTDRLRHTNAFTLRIQCATDDTHQDGPARIVSNSVSPFSRNFTLGQEGSALVFRLRTPDTGTNGYPLEIHVPGVFADRQVHEILATYDGATLLLARSHGGYVSRTELTPGVSLALASQLFPVQPGDLHKYEMAYVGALSLVPGLLIGLFGRTTRQRQALSVAWVVAFAVLLEVTIVRVSGRFFDWADVAQTAGIAAVVLTLCNAVYSSVGVSWQRTVRAGIARARREALQNQSGRGVSRARP